MREPRKVRPNEKYEGFDSKFEYVLYTTILSTWEPHPSGFKYAIRDKTYNPDFKKEINGKIYYIESKGRFWDHDEYSKYKWARESLGENEEIIFIFADPSLPMPRSKKRKDGTKLSHGEWAEKNDFRYFTKDTFSEDEL